MDGIIHALVGSIVRAPWGWSILVVIILSLIKVWPVIQLQTLNATAAMRGERRDDLHDCHERLDAIEGKLTAAIAQIHQLDMKLFGTVAAYRIIHDEMVANDPENLALHAARNMFRTTWDGPVEAAESLLQL